MLAAIPLFRPCPAYLATLTISTSSFLVPFHSRAAATLCNGGGGLRPRQAFGAKDPPWGPHLVTALLTVLPFAYIGLAARVLTKSNRLGKDDDGVGRAVARGGELIR